MLATLNTYLPPKKEQQGQQKEKKSCITGQKVKIRRLDQVDTAVIDSEQCANLWVTDESIPQWTKNISGQFA